ncbi:MAG TPA: BTAD domain-containing putative transcriptional regulator [Jatrophihabitans sp.]
MAGNGGGHGPPATALWQLQLLGAWSLRRAGTPVPIRHREQRLLAVLALHGGHPRQYIAGLLWPESTDSHAAGNLRAAVWNLDRAAPGLLIHDRTHIQLADGASVDVGHLMDATRDLLAPRALGHADVDYFALLHTLLREELLPGWYDDWLILERSRLQELRQQALEQLSDLLSERGDIPTALQAARAAVAIEPLRESAQRSLIIVHIRAGNHSDAVRCYADFRSRIRGELGVRPSGQLESLVSPLVGTMPPGRSLEGAFVRSGSDRRR